MLYRATEKVKSSQVGGHSSPLPARPPVLGHQAGATELDEPALAIRVGDAGAGCVDIRGD